MEQLWPWIGFGVLILVLLVLDLKVFHRNIHTPSLVESAGWSVFWISLGLAFNGFIWWWHGWEPAVQYLAGFLLEKSLSIDNIFVFAIIFRCFQVPLRYQYRVLFWGITGAIVTRLGFILIGTELVQTFEWTLAIFGAFLLYTGLRLAVRHEGQVDPERSWVLRFARRTFSVTHDDHGERFFVWENGRRCVTPLFLVLLVIEATDIMFAVDSVPAVFGVTRDPFIVFTSNIFAILGLRALYFLLAGVIEIFRFLNFGLSAVLVFIGAKMIAEYFVPQVVAHFFPTWVSLLVIIILIAASILASIVIPKKQIADS
jgi:tellurite resistance protein TerC